MAYHRTAWYSMSYLRIAKFVLNLGPNANKTTLQPSCSVHAELYAAAVHQWCKSLHCSSKTDLLGATPKSCLIHMQLDLTLFLNLFFILFFFLV